MAQSSDSGASGVAGASCARTEECDERQGWAGPKQAASVATLSGLVLFQVQWEVIDCEKHDSGQ